MALTPARCFALAGLLLLPVYLGTHGTVSQVIYELYAVAAIAALADRTRRETGPRRAPWALFGVALCCWSAGDILNVALTPPGGDPPFPSVVDACYLASYPLMALGLLHAIRLRSPGTDRLSAIDGFLVAAAGALPMYALWIQPAMQAAEHDTAASLVLLAYPAMDLLLVAMLVRFVLGDGRWSLSTVGFVTGVALVVASDTVYNAQLIAGTYELPGPTDIGWLIALVLWGYSALQPTTSVGLQPGTRPHGAPLVARSWILALIVILPLVAVGRAYIDGATLEAAPILLPLLVIAILMTLRVRLMARRSPTSWQAPAALAAVGLVVVLAAVAATRLNASGREQAAAAERVDALADAVQAGDGLVAWTLTVDPSLLPRVLPRLAAAGALVEARARQLDIPEAPAIQASEGRLVSEIRAQVVALRTTRDRNAVRASILSVMPLRDALQAQLADTSEQYHAAAASSARRGRIVSVALLATALLALWLLMLRFGSASRRAESAEERSRAVRESEDRIRALLDASADLITVVDADTRVLAHGDQVARVFGLDVVDEHLRLDRFLGADEAAATRRTLASMAGHPGARARLQWSIEGGEGAARQMEISAVDHTGDSRIGGIVLSVRDVTERRRLEAALHHQALHDPLTGLANRVFVNDRLAQLLTEDACGGEQHALVLLDLDDFRAVNDSFGHPQGDLILKEVARRLGERARPRDTLARVGGDSFAFLVEGITSQDEAMERVRLMLEAIDAPIRLDTGSDHLLRASIGVAIAAPVADGDEDDAVRLASATFRDAELAMYEAKRSEGNSAELFAPHMHEAVTQRLALRAEMVLALQRGEFVLHYQPIIELLSHQIAGYEALVRWQHPDRGMVSPAEFIPVAEQSGLIVELGDWVMREACRQLAEWQRHWPDERYVAVNVAGQQLERPDHLDQVRSAIEDAGIAPRQLVIEMTESSLIRDTDGSVERLEALRGLGIRLAIDDFGTGYSSLNYLHRFAVDVLKVDKSFVDDVTDGDRGRALVDAIVSMARRLGLTVVAEGIEELDQVDELANMRCEMGQGFHFSRPLAAAQVLAFQLDDEMREAA